MEEYNEKVIKKILKEELKKSRYKHTIGVSYTAMCLAMKYDIDIERAKTAGLLHDCAKCLSDEEMIKKCDKYKIEITDVEKKQPYLLHAKLGTYFAEKKYGVNDSEICSAILKHTTGSENMTMLEKIIFVADYIEPGREKAKNLDKIRKLAFEDIDKAIYIIMRDTLEYLESTKQLIDETTKIAFEAAKKNVNIDSINF